MHYTSFAFLATEAKVVSFKMFNSLTTKQQTTKFSSANFQKKVKSKLYHVYNSKMDLRCLQIQLFSSLVLIELMFERYNKNKHC